MSGPDAEHRPHAEVRPHIDAALARRLLDAQFPEWRELPIHPVEHDGWDNRTFRLGEELSVRLPSAAGYVEQVAKEQEWLPRLAPVLPLPIPQPIAEGSPDSGFPFPWSVYRWLPGRPVVLLGDVSQDAALAEAIGRFLVALRAAPVEGAPEPGTHNFFRGAPPEVYGEEALAAFPVLGADAGRARALWAEATESRWEGPPVWFHGDVAPGNLLTAGGALSAVIDFGTSGVGDPACDLVPAWTMFEGAARDSFRRTVGLDDATWARARGWALWKAAITLRDDPAAPEPRATLARLLA